jgi:hypothetical protein
MGKLLWSDKSSLKKGGIDGMENLHLNYPSRRKISS